MPAASSSYGIHYATAISSTDSRHALSASIFPFRVTALSSTATRFDCNDGDFVQYGRAAAH